MKVCAKCGVSKEPSLFSPDKANKDGLYGYCRECSNARARAAYAAKPDKSEHRKQVAEWRQNNLERKKELDRAAHQRHKEKRNAASVKYRAEHREETRALCRQWAKDNADKMRVTNADRRARKKNAIPPWADSEFEQFFVKEAYELARLRTVVTGVPWHVDHVVPLRNKRVCGLHCAANLQVITAVENHVKGNRVWPDMWT